MNIVYITNSFTLRALKRYFPDGINLPGQAASKYNRLLAEGLALQKDARVTVISEMPVSENNCKAKLIRKRREKYRRVRYVYLPIINIHRVKDILSVFTSFWETIRSLDVGRSVVIADILAAPTALGGYIAAKIKRVPYTAVVTDLPEYVYGAKDRVYKKTSEILLKGAGSYVFLTEEMNEPVNDDGKPFVVIEGLTDVSDSLPVGRKEPNNQIKTVLYTGSLDRKDGIMMLTDAFIKADIQGCELHICGNGDLADKIRRISKKHKNIVYHGSVPSDEAVKMQREATLLVNPRPSKPEYTRYSFPSKTMEYLSSGTPVLMTDLPGVSDDYKKYVFVLKDESIDGMAKALKEILSKPEKELAAKGKSAFRFALCEKNNKQQAEKLLEMLV